MHKKNIKVLLILLIIQVCRLNAQLSINQTAEQTLYTSLLSSTNYNKNIRPSTQVTVRVTMYLKQIVSLDEKNNILTTSSYIAQLWEDPRLVWNTATNNNIESLVIPATNLWIPDTFILNSGDTNGYLTVTSSTHAVVYNDGTVYLVLPTIAVKTRCILSLKYYPFDSQTCSILITSWAQTIENINYDLSQDNLDLSDYIEHPVWSITEFKITDTSGLNRNPWEQSKNSQLNLVLNLKRKPLYYIMNGVFPCLILNIVILMAFSLPFPAQMGTSMSSFMTYAVYSLRISSELPTQSDFLPTISIYFLFSIIFTNCCMVWFIVHNELSKLKILPKPVLFVCIILGKIANCCTCEEKKIKPSDTSNPIKDLNVEEQSNDKVVKKVAELERPRAKCNKCDRCEECEKEFQKDETKKKSKDEKEDHLKYLNRFILAIAAVCMIIGQLSIWLSY